MKPRYVTNSELRTFKRCRRKWWLSYYRALSLKREDVAGKPMTLGTRVHAALETIYTPGSEVDPIGQVHDGIERDVAAYPDQETEIRKEGELARIMVEGYLDWIEETGADLDLELVAAEETVDVPIGPHPHRLRELVVMRAKLDARFRRKSTGAVLFLDHKIVRDFRDRRLMLALDEQMLRYHLLLRLKYQEARIDGAIYNMLRQSKRTARATPPFYAREEVRHNDHELRAFYERTMAEISDLLAAEHALDGLSPHRSVVYPNPTRDCSWDCPFTAVCGMYDDDTTDPEFVIRSYYEAVDPLARYEPRTAEEGE